MMKRNPDGTWRNTRQPIVAPPEILRSEWIKAEALRLKTMGLSFEEMAEQITQVGRGQGRAMVTIPADVVFPENYSISRQAVHKAFKKAIARQPALELGELRKLDHARSEEMFLNLQRDIRKANLRAIEVGIKVLEHSAKMNGLRETQTAGTELVELNAKLDAQRVAHERIVRAMTPTERSQYLRIIRDAEARVNARGAGKEEGA
jgi:hypothetical protein